MSTTASESDLYRTYGRSAASAHRRQQLGSRPEHSHNNQRSSRAARSDNWRSQDLTERAQPKCRFVPGEVIHIPSKVKPTSMVHRENYGGKPWGHPAIVIAVEQMPESPRFILTVRGITSNGNKPVSVVYPGREYEANRRTHVLIRPFGEKSDDEWRNDKQVIPDLRLRKDSDNFKNHSYVRVAHIFRIEEDNVDKHLDRIFLDNESLRSLAGCPEVKPPPRRQQVPRDPQSRSPSPLSQHNYSGSPQRPYKHGRTSSGDSQGSAYSQNQRPLQRRKTSGAFQGVLPSSG